MTMKLGRLLTIAFLPASLFACVYEDEPPRRLAPDPHPYEQAPASSSTGEVPTGGTNGDTAAAPSSPSPMLVEIDTDQTMTADPGQGVGVFVEYGTGGKWHVWWTCDTAKTGERCDFAVSLSAKSGNISNVDASQLGNSGLMTTPTPSSLEASVTTATEVHGVKFDTNPGAVITLKASLGGAVDGSFLFFVQDGKVNGGYTGKLSNPLQLQGKTP
jgi:hypothetical protein